MTLLLDAAAQLGVEIVRLRTGGAVIEMFGNLRPLGVVDLAGEQVVQLVERVFARRGKRRRVVGIHRIR